MVIRSPRRTRAARSQPTAPPLSHEEVRRQFADYLSTDLDPSAQARIGAHLARCSACAVALVAFRQSLRATVALLHGLPRREAPAVLRQRLLALPNRLRPHI
jgi:anti-sigma factor RsiW